MGVAEFVKHSVLGAVDVLAKIAVAIAGAYCGLMCLLLAVSAVSAWGMLREHARGIDDGGIPLGGAVLPWFALVWLGAALAGALSALWLWRRLLRAVFIRFRRRSSAG